jgi:acyl-coenzyme A thioesterase PaaI-like protein
MSGSEDSGRDGLTPQQRWARSEENNCFVCGPSNPIGLRIEFELDGDICRAEFTPGDHHNGYGGVLHGGILYSALDDVMANVLYLRGIRAVTARCEIRYRGEPVTIGTNLLLEGRVRRRRGPLAILEGRAIRASNGEVVAEAEASFMIVGEVNGNGSGETEK